MEGESQERELREVKWKASSFALTDELANMFFRKSVLQDTLHCVGLFFCQVTNDREFVHLSLVGLDQKDDPNHD